MLHKYKKQTIDEITNYSGTLSLSFYQRGEKKCSCRKSMITKLIGISVKTDKKELK